ncbi:endo-alpha-N-acetylgalactosaminidase family protein [Streptomyces beihaiensis]|uniref:Endo-alpha-N-acetylgalactosaminidase family protein n=1 Tax=Streptomyces beihaiensis TaxID=2984495 RepID=A0ABT3U054_9ACTN|nr:endo-alpha-N-acetylgalactosaminidase family protein [Streptomyces beihaiensis]MCX3062086.1 endo-alpha-N-acetylgalactosaminidase family protein [Streptomyces beihaiensis]
MQPTRQPSHQPDEPKQPDPDETGHRPGPSRRAVVAATAAAGASAALGGLTGPAQAATPATPATLGTARISSPELDVRVHPAFPAVVSYTDRATGAVLHAQPDPVTTLLVDGTEHTPEVTSTIGSDRADYRLTLTGGTTIDVRIGVEGHRVDWRVTDITDTDALRVGTLEIPGLALLSVRSDQPGATLLAARLQLDKAKSGDTLVTPTADSTPVARTGCAYAVVAHDGLGGAVETNTVYDKPSGSDGTTWENGRLWHDVVRAADHTAARLTPGQWTHRAATSPVDATEPLPYAAVIVTGDRNGDGTVDWQDAAIAFRDIAVTPLGADEQHLRVVPHIPFNFASQATNPFLATLDNVKRIHLATDGLRQYTLLKGYQSEGHDSAHPDYAGNYNTRAGGLDDLNTLVREGSKWNSDFAVHVNATEAYPVAHAFSETLVDKTNRQWDWLDQSYRIDQRRDLVSGDIIKRFADLRHDADPALDSIYVDVFRESGWTSDRLQRALRDQGWHVASEWAHGLERSSLWSHWATETDYGPDTSRGINSRLVRFIRHHQKDVFADKWPLLGTARMGNFEGWRGKTDWTTFYRLIWTHSLPAKYLQAQPIRTWTEHEVTFLDPAHTTVSDATGARRITTDDRLVYDDGSYLLPWEPRRPTDPDRLYHYNPKGGTSTWHLPRAWESLTRTALYRLTDQGRTFVTYVPVSAGKVTLKAAGDQPYVLYKDRDDLDRDPDWGQGTPLRDPGFHSGTLDAWQVTGPAGVELSDLGDHELVIAPGAAATVSQRLSRLAPGRYAASVQVEVGTKAGARRKASLTVRTADGVTATNWTETSTAVNYVAADRKHGTRFQRMFTYFTVPEGGGPVTLALTAEAGPDRVRFDSVRVAATDRPAPPRATVATEDFEHVPQGWGPFVKGDAGGSTDPRTHIGQRHTPYTQRGWNGKAIDDVIDDGQSLKSRGENTGLVYRTVPHTVRFTPGKRYQVTFRYENEKAAQYAWVTGVDTGATTKELDRKDLPVATAPTALAYTFTAPGKGEAWVGLRKTGGDGTAEFALDAFEVTELA